MAGVPVSLLPSLLQSRSIFQLEMVAADFLQQVVTIYQTTRHHTVAAEAPLCRDPIDRKYGLTCLASLYEPNIVRGSY